MAVVLYETKDHVAYITLNRPERLNAVSRELAASLVEVLARYEGDKNLWAAVITGAGERSFSVGADLKDEAHRADPAQWEAAFVRSLYAVKKPLIAAVNGHCLGAGFTIALACDIRVASENASFGTPDQKLNTVDCAASLLLSHYIPSSAAMEILFTGEPVSAREAYRLGLVSKVVPAAGLMDEAGRIADRISGNGPMAIRACKELNRRGRTMALDDAVGLFEAMARNVLSSEDTVEGVTAWLEKRKPVWKLR